MNGRAAPARVTAETAWHALHAEEALAALGTDAARGLADDAARARQRRFGPNALPQAPVTPPWRVFLRQFASPLIYLLLGAATLAVALGERGDGAVILAVVLLNALIGAFHEGRAEQSLAALRRMLSAQARVVRGGEQRRLAAAEVVPGDILVLDAGDAVPADARLIEGAALQLAEAPLTGESLPVTKTRDRLATDTLLPDRTNMIYAGTHVTAGRARAVVTATGTATEIGRIAALGEGAPPVPTPLERRMAVFGRQVLVAAFGLLIVVIVLGVVDGVPLGTIVMVAISQVVSMVPEGLPVALTIALAVGVRRMAQRRAIVRRLAAVEALGATTVICSDKTGTLTRNEMTVTAVWLPDVGDIAVSGVGYEPRGTFSQAGRAVDAGAGLRRLLEAGVLCNDGRLLGPDQADARWRALGDPTEVALIVAAVKAGAVPAELARREPRVAEIPFDPGARVMATEHRGGAGVRVLIKGAPEVVLPLCARWRRDDRVVAIEPSERPALQQAVERLADRALRVLAVAEVPEGDISGAGGVEAFRGRAILLGLVGQMDPPREEAAAAVAECRSAGIRPVLITGDHKATALAVARQLGIAAAPDGAIDGPELESLSPAALDARLQRATVFARVQPAQKLRLVEAFQRRGEVVAMTGDGVNDAPSLMRADVGVAMGLAGTDVAKEAAKIVITDDNFATIVAAVREGRVIFSNLRKVVLYQFASGLAEVAVLLAALLAGYPPPLAAVQILWNNLVSEGVVTVNLIMEPAEGDEMRRAPLAREAGLLSRALVLRTLFMAGAMAFVIFGWFLWRHHAGVPFVRIQTETFTLLALCEWFNVLSCRSERRSAFAEAPWRNPWLAGGLLAGMALQAAVVYVPALNGLFHTAPIPFEDLDVLLLLASGVLWVEELRKRFARSAP